MNTQAVIAYLRSQQTADGSFAGAASPSVEPFVVGRYQPTIFPTILILDCLHDVVGTEDIRLRATKYVQSQVSKQGSWNYWERASRAKQQEPYPDDLDDTACAVAALARSDASWLTGARLGQFARLLVATEKRPGGPYNTWLIDVSRAKQWQHIDIAVNANIGYALAGQSVQLEGLTSYLDERIQAGSLTSDYYVGQAPVLYFLSRWYQGKQRAALQAKVAELAAEQMTKDALQQALLLSAGCKLGLPKTQLRQLASRLQAGATAHHWPAAALYLDPVYNKQQYFGGSSALTTAFVLESLTAYANVSLESPVVIARKRGVPRLMADVRKEAESIRNLQLRRRYLAAANRVMHDAAGEQITAAASLVALAGCWDISKSTLTHLDLASVNGWMAYTLYDDMLDGQSDIEQLNVANLALRRSYGNFIRALPNDPKFSELVATTFDTIDGANDWELHHGRAAVSNGVIELRKLPDYGDYSQLAERSLGHSLAACAAATLHYGTAQNQHVVTLQTFFKHFLIARQLNDDAHDWQEDLAVGHISSVVNLLLRATNTMTGKVLITEQRDGLRQHFWQQTIVEVAELIRGHLQAANQALQELDEEINTAVFMGWLDTLESSVSAALRGRDEALQFMQGYEESHV